MLDVLAIGDAVVDVIAATDDAFIAEAGLVKGSMRLIDQGEARSLYARMGQAQETSGGSAANTVAGIAALGGRAGFIGQVADDQLGDIFSHDIRALGVEFRTPAIKADVPTGRCLILVTPDAQRTMNTFPGASHQLKVAALDREQIRSAAILYLEGYLLGPERPRAAMREAIAVARGAGRKVAFTLSDIACIARQKDAFLELLDSGAVDMLFANEQEIVAISGCRELAGALAVMERKVPLLVVTCGERGAVAVEAGTRFDAPAAHVPDVVDTTGAGDLFAAGFLTGRARGRSLPDCLRMGAVAAGEVISHFGARPLANLKELVNP